MPKKDIKELRKERVIGATIRCIVEKGLANMSIKDIAKEADVSTGIIYHYFKNKEDLLLQVIKSTFQKSHEQVMETVETLFSPVEKLERHLENILAVPKENTDFFVVFLNYLGEAKYHPELQAIVVKFLKNLRHYTEQYLQDGVRHGLYTSDKISHIPALLYSVGLGLGVMWMLDPESVDTKAAGKLFLQWIQEHLGVGMPESDS